MEEVSFLFYWFLKIIYLSIPLKYLTHMLNKYFSVVSWKNNKKIIIIPTKISIAPRNNVHYSNDIEDYLQFKKNQHFKIIFISCSSLIFHDSKLTFIWTIYFNLIIVNNDNYISIVSLNLFIMNYDFVVESLKNTTVLPWVLFI